MCLPRPASICLEILASRCLSSRNGTTPRATRLLSECNPKIYPAGATFSFAELGEYCLPTFSEAGIPTLTLSWFWMQPRPLWKLGKFPPRCSAWPVRQQARLCKDWAEADDLRKQIEGLSWRVEDTPAGPKLFPGKGGLS